jgi:hypothetical protein
MSVLLAQLCEGRGHGYQALDGSDGEAARIQRKDLAPQVGDRHGDHAFQARRESHHADTPQPLMQLQPN